MHCVLFSDAQLSEQRRVVMRPCHKQYSRWGVKCPNTPSLHKYKNMEDFFLHVAAGGGIPENILLVTFTFLHVSLPGQESTADVSLWLLGVSVNVLSLFITFTASQCEWTGEIALLRTQLWNWNWSRGSNYWSSSRLGSRVSHLLPITLPCPGKSSAMQEQIFRGATWKSIHLSHGNIQRGNMKIHSPLKFGEKQEMWNSQRLTLLCIRCFNKANMKHPKIEVWRKPQFHFVLLPMLLLINSVL